MLLENYITTLKQQINKNSETKINIHLPVFGKIKEHCIYLNKEISKITKNQIDFTSTSFMLPHITLYIGFVRNNKDYILLNDKLTTFIKTFKPLKLSFSKPYIKNNKNYVFIDIVEKDKIFKVKKDLYNIIKPYVKDVNWDVVNEPAHITIAYIENNNTKVNKLISKYTLTEELNVSKINLALSGNKGSCLGILKEFIKE